MGTELLSDHDRLDDVRSLSMPTLVLVGEEDVPFLGPSERLAEAIGPARLEVVPAAGHSPQFENPEVWEKFLFAFLDEQRP